jgi:GH24 family phage-related lysozyme (muramidase)
MGKDKKELTNFLLWEYGQNRIVPPMVHINGKDYMVPYAYVCEYKDPKQAFVKDYFDLMRKDYLKYQNNHEDVKYISLTSKNGEQHRLVVPYAMRNRKENAAKIAKKVFARADKKYWEAVELSLNLTEAYPDRPFKTFIDYPNLKEMRKAYNQHQFREARDRAAYITKKVGAFLSKNAVKATDNIKTIDVDKLKVKARRWAVGFMLAATVSAAVYEAYQIKDKADERKEITAKDPLGHIQMFSRCHDAIKTSLAFVENFADSTFIDGEGFPTIGYGCTYYLDENGVGNRKISPVKEGETITMEEANVQKERYLEFRGLKQIQECVKVPMDEKTTIATYNFAYVIGPEGFKKSKYLEALNDGKTGHDLVRYLTGFRKQKGLLARFYFMGALLEDKIKTSDLLNLTAEGCYNLKINDVCVHEKRKLKLDEDNFAEFDFSKLDENLQKASGPRRSVALHNGQCQKVREILPESIIQGTLEMEASKNYQGSRLTSMLTNNGR